jgi:hypothetical protein
MSVLSVDLVSPTAGHTWADLGVVLLEQKASRIACEVHRWTESWAAPVVELALRIHQLASDHAAGVLMLDGPQAWKSNSAWPDGSPRMTEGQGNRPSSQRFSDCLHSSDSERFVGYCLALYSALARLGWQRLGAGQEIPSYSGALRTDTIQSRFLVESYPDAAWKSLGIRPLPAKGQCRVSDLADAWAALTTMLPITATQPPNHSQMQAIVGGLPGLGIEERMYRKKLGPSPHITIPSSVWEGVPLGGDSPALPAIPPAAPQAGRSSAARGRKSSRPSVFPGQAPN